MLVASAGVQDESPEVGHGNQSRKLAGTEAPRTPLSQQAAHAGDVPKRSQRRPQVSDRDQPTAAALHHLPPGPPMLLVKGRRKGLKLQLRHRTVDGGEGDTSFAEPKDIFLLQNCLPFLQSPHDPVPARSQVSPVAPEDRIFSELTDKKNLLLHLQEEVAYLRTSSASKVLPASVQSASEDSLAEPTETPKPASHDGS
ncbi:hypothetical protein GJAV_G00099990 [Gymnothorax javanicus]|nr:hypothetical protein GJAV_G00099990 [Gymnothorax javanicus]